MEREPESADVSAAASAATVVSAAAALGGYVTLECMQRLMCNVTL